MSLERICMVAVVLCAAAFLLSPAPDALPLQSAQQGEADLSKTPGLGPAGKLVSVEFEPTGEPVLRTSDARRQLLVTGTFNSGQLHDLTQKVTFTSTPTGIVEIDSSGLITPLANGAVTISAKSSAGPSAELQLTVEQVGLEIPINFSNQIMPVFTKLGCNTGACHGKSGGQNGFRMSLLGFYPDEDYEHLVMEGRGRRVFPASPEFSLLLLKPTGMLPHGGGRRMDSDSLEAKLIYRWIEQGMPYGDKSDPVVERIEVFPKSRKLNRGSQQQLAVVAHYSDGTTRDVTRLVKYDSNDVNMAEITFTGLVKTLDVPGETTVMVRFQDHVSVFRAIIPLGLKVSAPPQRNFIDKHVFSKLQSLGIPFSALCDDATFLRRVYVDVTGQLPTAETAEKFLADKNANKRDALIDQLLNSPAYGDYFANKWVAVLRNQRSGNNGKTVTFGFHKFVRDSMQRNVPYDQFVRSIIAATGDARSNPAAAWHGQVTSPVAAAEDTAQLFLGLRIKCAHCHHHPYEKWSQDDYFGLTAFFTRVQRKTGGPKNDRSQTISHKAGKAESLNPRTGKKIKPRGLDGESLEIPDNEDPRGKLVDWMTKPDNPFFAKALVNRYWKHFFNRGIVEPEDDMRVTNPPSNPELLDALAEQFIKSKFDLKGLVRTICRSRTYQLSSEPNGFNVHDRNNFSSYNAKRLNAEVLFDALNQVTGATAKFKDLPAGTRAVQLPDNTYNNYFLMVFGKPLAATACECERSSEANLAQTLHMLNSPEVQSKISAKTGRLAKIAADEKRSDTEKIRELYLWLYSRPPKQDEMDFILKHFEKREDKQKAFEDVMWALLQTKEFLFNR